MTSFIRETAESGERFYGTPAGRLPSVTTILEATDDKRSLISWQEKNPEAALAAKLKGELSARRGSEVHRIADCFLRNRDWSKDGLVPNSAMQGEDNRPYNFEASQRYLESIKDWMDYISPLRNFLVDFGEMVWSEGPMREEHRFTIGDDSHPRVWSSLGYAGCPDWIGDFRDKLTLLDLKTSDIPYRRWGPKYTARGTDEYRTHYRGYKKFCKVKLQLVAYKLAIKETLGIEVEALVAAIATPKEVFTFTLNEVEQKKAEEEWLQRINKFYELKG